MTANLVVSFDIPVDLSLPSSWTNGGSCCVVAYYTDIKPLQVDANSVSDGCTAGTHCVATRLSGKTAILTN